MASLTLFRVEKVEVLESHLIAGCPGAYAQSIVITGGDGRFEISLHSDKPLEVKGTPKKDYSFPAFVPCGHKNTIREGLNTYCADCGMPMEQHA